MALHFDITGDNSNFLRKLEETKRGVSEAAKFMESQGKKIDSAFNKISLGTLEKFREIMSELPNGAKELEPFKKQIADLEKRIEAATKRIIELQNQAKQPTAVNTNTGNIKQESSAYESLLESIKDVLGARGSNVAAMLQEQNAIRLNQRELKVLEGIEIKGLKLSDAQQTRRIQLVNSISEHKQAISSLRQVISNEIKLEQAATTSMDEMSQSLGRMRMAYRQLSEQERNSKFGLELQKNIQEADNQIKQLDASIGNYQRNVGNYKSQWNGLSMSIQQVAREMPSLAYGPKVFFSAISNNLPILADELKRAKNEFNALKAEGKTATPVWKQVATSLFSWNTALTVGVTLLTLYGDKLVDLVSGLFNAKDATKELLSAEQEMALARKKAISDSVNERTELNLLYNKLKNATVSTEEYSAAVSEWIKKYPQHANVMNGELVSLGKLGSAYQALSKQIIEAAKARSYSDKITELTKKRDDAEFRRLNSLNSLGRSKSALAINDSDLQKVITSNAQKQYDAIVQEVANYDSKIESIGKNIKLDSLFPQPEKGTYDYWQQQVQIADTALKQIDSKQRALLDAGKFDGIDAAVVSNYKTQSKLLEEAQKELKAYDTSGKSEKKQESAADKLRKEQEKYKELASKQSAEQARAEEDLQNQLAQSKIDAMANGFDKVQAQRELDNKKEIKALERQKEDYIQAYIQAQKELFNAEEDLKAQKDKNYKKKAFDSSSVSVNTSGFDTVISNTKKRQGNDQIAHQESDWNEYIIKYGTFLQKKQAITEKYNKLIDEADTSGKAALLQKELEEALSGLSVDKLKKEINWDVVFGDMSKVAKKQLQEVKRQLTEFKKSSEFKNSTPEQVKVIEEALDKINSALVDKSGFFGGLGDSLAEYKLKLEEAKKAQEEYDEALKTGNQALIEKATETRNTANANVTNSGTNVEKSGDKAVKNINAVSSAIVQLGKKDISLTDIGNTVGTLVDTLGKSGSMIGGIISAILSIVDAAGDVGTFQYGMDLVGNVSSKVTDAFARDTEAITGIDMSFLKSADYDDYNELKEQYETINSIWAELIDKKIEYLETGTTEERKRTEGEILDLIGKQEQAYRNLGLERLNAGASAGSSSIGVRIKKNMSDEGWNQVKSALGEELYSQINDGRMEKLFSLSAEQLEKLKGSAPDFWAKLDDDVRKYLEDIIKCGEQTEETIKKAEELWAGMSFDSMVDQFKSALSDMDSSTEDFADDFQQYMINAMIDSFVNGEIFQKKLKDWHKKLAEYSESDKKITEEEKNSLKNDWDTMVQEGLDYRNNLFESMGFSNSSSSSQDSTNGGFQTMSQDTGDELNGRFTALQISNEEIKNSMLSMLVSMNLISVSTNTNGITLMEIKNIALMSNSHLEDIAKYTKELIGFKQTIANIETSAKAMAGK